MSDAAPPKLTTNRPRPKYQVFISSTYDDLHDERREVTWEVLKAGHIPAGMENFTATDDRGWKTIQRSIDRSDYYVVLVAGRYGSVDPATGLSWTEREYRYANENKIPVLAFVRQDDHIIKTVIEKDPGLQVKLEMFKTALKGTHHCDRWGTVDDLRARVAQAIRQHIQDDEDNGTARPGWYRGNEIPGSVTALEEFARLSAENEKLRKKVADFERTDIEVLEVLDEDEEPLADFEYDAPVIKVVDDRSKAPSYAMLASGFTEISLELVQNYADDMARTCWCKLKVRNSGTKPARRLSAEFKISSAMLHVDDIAKPSRLPDLAGSPWYFDPKEHVYVESVERDKDCYQVLQRISQIGVGGTETLIPLGIRPIVRAHEGGATVQYKIRSEDGVVVSGEFKVLMTLRAPETMKVTEVLADAD